MTTDYRARKISDDVFNSSLDSEGGSPLLMSRKDLPLMSPLVRSAQNGSISEVFFSRHGRKLTRQASVDDNDEPDAEDDDIENMAKFSALGTSDINSRKRRLQSQSTFEQMEGQDRKQNRLNGTTPQKMTTTKDVLK